MLEAFLQFGPSLVFRWTTKDATARLLLGPEVGAITNGQLFALLDLHGGHDVDLILLHGKHTIGYAGVVDQTGMEAKSDARRLRWVDLVDAE